MTTFTRLAMLATGAALVPTPAWAASGEPMGALSLLAPIAAIALALITRKVVPSLALGAVVGALVAAEFIVGDAFRFLVEFLRASVLDLDHMTITLFSLVVAGTVGLVSRAGGTRALVELLQVVARGRRRTQTASWLAGLVVFFDDYANCLVVGHAMAPLCDRFGVSRAKLAWIVDATAAPVASLALVSTWVGYEIGLVEEALEVSSGEALQVFVQSLPYRFFSLLMLAMVAIVAITGRDFGAMRQAESELAAGAGGEQAPAERATSPWVAAGPILVMVVVAFTWLVVEGARSLPEGGDLLKLLSVADPYRAMLAGSLASLLVAVALVLGTRSLPASRLGTAAWAGVRPVIEALVVLYLAWTLGDAVSAAHAPEYLSSLLGGRLPEWGLPAMAFLVAAGTSFATGTSFGTMGMILPLALPMAAVVDGGVGPSVHMTTAAVLAGSILGDQGSPISDTTLLSALGSGVDLLLHFRTQLPYVLLVGGVALVVGYLPAGLGVSPWLLLPAGTALIAGVVLLVGRPPAPAAATSASLPGVTRSLPPVSTDAPSPRPPASKPPQDRATSLAPGVWQSIEDLGRPEPGDEE